MARIDLLAVATPSPLLAPQLRDAFVVHELLHEADPAAFAAVAPRIRAIVGGGESRVGAAKARGIPVTHTPDVLNEDVADLALALMLGISRQLVRADHHVRSGAWTRGPLELGRKMSGARLGLVGIGRIGQGIARRAAAFGMEVAYTARHAHPELPYAFFPDATAVAEQSDYLVVITPGGEATRRLIDAKVLRALGPEGILVNVSRGSVVDEAALIEALESRSIAGAALDVFETEPAVPERLRQLPNVLLSPHIGSGTHATRQAMADLVVANLGAHFAGQPLPTPVPECRR
jgi:hydroxypyruvate reductase